MERLEPIVSSERMKEGFQKVNFVFFFCSPAEQKLIFLLFHQSGFSRSGAFLITRLFKANI